MALWEKIKPGGTILGIDRSPELIKNLEYSIQKLGLEHRIILVCDNFANLKLIARKHNFAGADGILFDLGWASYHIEHSKEGFSFLKNEPLIMRYDWPSENPQSEEITASRILNYESQKNLEKILREYGQERFASEISKTIAAFRKTTPIYTTSQLVKIVEGAVPAWYRRRKIHFATKTFQALRIAVNDEFINLKKVLPQALDLLTDSGRLTVISFHSLEDKIVKNFLREQAKAQSLKILTKKPLRPGREEIQINPRCRSARLRAAIKIKNPK